MSEKESQLKMTDFSRQLKPFAENIKNVINEYDSVFTKIAESLPLIQKEVDDNVLEAWELIRFVFTEDADDNSYGVKHELSQFHDQLEDAVDFIKKTQDEDKKIFNELMRSMDFAKTAVSRIEEINEISEDLKVFAINSIVYAQKAGENGKGYQVISGEFIKISEIISKYTEKIIKEGYETDLLNQDLAHHITEYEGFIKEHVSSISSDSLNLQGKTNKSVKNFTIIMNDLLGRINSIKEPTSKIMMELQVQDIIKQLLDRITATVMDILTVLDHIPADLRSLSEAEKNSLYTLIDSLIDKTENQLSDVSGKMKNLLERLDDMLSGMISLISDIDQDKDHFTELVFKGKESDARSSILYLLFKTPSEIINSIISNQKISLKYKSDIVKKLTLIEKKIDSEKGISDSFETVIELLKNLLVLSQIEKARYSLAIPELADNGYRFTELSEITEEIKESHEMINSILPNSINIVNDMNISYLATEDKLRNTLDMLDKTGNLFSDNFNSIIEITGNMSSELGQYLDLFHKLRDLGNDIENSIAVCREIRSNMGAEIDKTGSFINTEDCIYSDNEVQEIAKKYYTDYNQSESNTDKDNSSGVTLF